MYLFAVEDDAAEGIVNIIEQSTVVNPDRFCKVPNKTYEATNRQIPAYTAIIVVILVTHITWRNNILFHL